MIKIKNNNSKTDDGEEIKYKYAWTYTNNLFKLYTKCLYFDDEISRSSTYNTVHIL